MRGEPAARSAPARSPAVRPWEPLGSDEVLEAGWLRVTRERARSPRTGGALDFHVVHMPDWLLVVPVTAVGRLVMVRQYRHASRRVGLEVPGGLLGRGDAHPEEGAARELAEETGYGGAPLAWLGTLMPQPALLANRVHIYLAQPVAPVAARQLDAGEDIEVVLVHPDRVGALVASGEIHNAMTVTALALAGLGAGLEARRAGARP